jgi:hypothetical protein
MRIGDRYDLTYCSNIHAGETWDDVFAALVAALPVVRRHLQTDAAFAVGLRLSAAAAATLDRGETLQTFRKFLSDQNCYVPTINGFPYGAFHGTRVKERVYEPDWRDPRRVNYSNQLARILAALQAPTADRPVSISTVPGAFRDAAREPADRAAIARGILEHAVYLARLRDEMGVTVTLAIEPEPACVIETVSEAVTFFVDELLSAAAVSRMNQHHGSKLTSSEIARHVGICKRRWSNWQPQESRWPRCNSARRFGLPGRGGRRRRTPYWPPLRKIPIFIRSSSRPLTTLFIASRTCRTHFRPLAKTPDRTANGAFTFMCRSFSTGCPASPRRSLTSLRCFERFAAAASRRVWK